LIRKGKGMQTDSPSPTGPAERTIPKTGAQIIVTDIKDLARTTYEAFHIASTGRPGPVLIDVPADLQFQKHSSNGPVRLNLPGYRVPKNGHARQINEAAQAINRSERPVLLAGGGVITANASQELRNLASKANLPVAMTLMGLGSFDQCRPESLDMPGMHGAPYANYAIQECDLLIAAGARFDDRVTGKVETFAPKAKIVHIDIDPSNISKTVPADIPLVGDARVVLAALAECVEHRQREAWFARIADWKRQYAVNYDRSASSLKPQHVIEELYRRTEGKPCVVDFHVDAEENVFPIVPAGKGLHEMEGLHMLQNTM